jgi:hypothetical protein
MIFPSFCTVCGKRGALKGSGSVSGIAIAVSNINRHDLSHIEAKMYRSQTLTKGSPNSTLQLGIFVAELHRFVQLIEADIQHEEERSRVFDVSNATYSVRARQLRNRRDNLIATISLLDGRRERASA